MSKENKLRLIEPVEWRGFTYLYEWCEGGNVEDYQPVTLVHGICFDDRNRVLIQREYGAWRFQGGAPEIGETYLETLGREMYQETGIKLQEDKMSLLGAFKINGPTGSTSREFYQLCVFCRVASVHNGTSDPEGDTIEEIRFVDPSTIDTFVNWGDHGRQMMKAALKALSGGGASAIRQP